MRRHGHDPSTSRTTRAGRDLDPAEHGPAGVASVQAMMMAGGNLAMVQLSEGGAGAAAGEGVRARAAEGVAGASGALPHLGAIQASFGRHDVSGVSSAVGGGAGAACQDIGASAYAMGDAVAFGGAPDVHTAAHEAAHVVQQRAGVQLDGGVGRAGDAHERHADAVADRVVQGQSAEDLLDQYGGSGGGARGVQRKSDVEVTSSTRQTTTATATTSSDKTQQLKFSFLGVPVSYSSGGGKQGLTVATPPVFIPKDQSQREMDLLPAIDTPILRLYGIPIGFARVGAKFVKHIQFQLVAGEVTTAGEDGSEKHELKAVVTPTMGIKPYLQAIAGLRYEGENLGALVAEVAWNVEASAPIEVGVSRTVYADSAKEDDTTINAKMTAMSLDSFCSGKVFVDLIGDDDPIPVGPEWNGEKTNYGKIELDSTFFATGDPNPKKPGAKEAQKPVPNLDLTEHLSRAIGVVGELVGIESPESVRKRIAAEIGDTNDFHAAFTKEKRLLVAQGMPRTHAQNIAGLRTQQVVFGSNAVLMGVVQAELPLAEQEYQTSQADAEAAAQQIRDRLAPLAVPEGRVEHLAGLVASWHRHPDALIAPYGGKFIKEPNPFKSQATLARIEGYVEAIEEQGRASSNNVAAIGALDQARADDAVDEGDARGDAREMAGEERSVRPGQMTTRTEDEEVDLAFELAGNDDKDVAAGVDGLDAAHRERAVADANTALCEEFEEALESVERPFQILALGARDTDERYDKVQARIEAGYASARATFANRMRQAVAREVTFLEAMGVAEDALAELGWRQSWDDVAEALVVFRYNNTSNAVPTLYRASAFSFTTTSKGFSMRARNPVPDDDTVIIY